MFSSTKYLGVTVTYGGDASYIVQVYDMTRSQEALDVRVCDIIEATGIVSGIVRTHDPALGHSQAQLDAMIHDQLLHLALDDSVRASMWLPPETADGPAS